MKHTLFPLFVDLSGQEVLMIGAGTIAARRIHILLPFVQHMTVIAPTFCPAVLAEEKTSAESLHLIQQTMQLSDLPSFPWESYGIVLAATDDAALNAEVARECRSRRIPVNVSSDQTLCDFQFPSIVQTGNLVVGINASGRDHALVKQSRQRIEEALEVTGADRRYL